ncbi:unnamed protein product [Mytilus coruscus]|uniref:C1q domain-containing protein n=1 Tax=Mytilus coruscus TaxID=42192 RepID=A0A6J8BZH0_MYTCO|nr:unnamed protein product [Mytilus coruscus]
MEDLTDVLKLESFCCLFGWLKLFLLEALSVSQSDVDCCESSVVVDTDRKTNVGAGYDPLTGVFVAPNPGTYHFTSVIYNAAIGDDVITQMNKNNEILVRGYSASTTSGESHVMNAVAQLQTGDHIFIKHRGSSVDYIRGGLHSSFSGFEI